MRAACALLLVACAGHPAPAPPPPAPVAAASTFEDASTATDASTAKEASPAPLPAPADPSPPPPPPQRSPPDAKACAARGGTLQPVCMGGIVACVIPYKDAGKRCIDKKDCTGDCIFAGTDVPPAGTKVAGKCQPTSDACGCAARIVNGRIGLVMCID